MRNPGLSWDINLDVLPLKSVVFLHPTQAITGHRLKTLSLSPTSTTWDSMVLGCLSSSLVSSLQAWSPGLGAWSIWERKSTSSMFLPFKMLPPTSTSLGLSSLIAAHSSQRTCENTNQIQSLSCPAPPGAPCLTQGNNQDLHSAPFPGYPWSLIPYLLQSYLTWYLCCEAQPSDPV